MSKLLVKHDNSTRRLTITWPEGYSSEYPYIWLRHYLFHPATGRPEQRADDNCLIIEPIEAAELAEQAEDSGVDVEGKTPEEVEEEMAD